MYCRPFSSPEQALEELSLYPGIGTSVSKMLKFYVKVFYVMGKALTGELSCPYDRSCFAKRNKIPG